MVKSRRSTSWRGSLLEMHAGGAPAIGVLVVAAEGGHFHLRESIAHQHHAEVRAHAAGVGKQAHDAVGARIGRNVEILGFRAQQQVAYAAAHQVRLVARPAQLGDHRARQRFGFHEKSLPYANMCLPSSTGGGGPKFWGAVPSGRSTFKLKPVS
jgi:hypothetical protein